MSAAATAAGYLYASGRLRGRAAREQGVGEQPEKKQAQKEVPHKEVRVAVLEPREEPKPAQRKTPKIEYRTRRRWSPE